MITIPNWMFLSTFERFRLAILQSAPIENLVHNGRGVWGSDFGSCTFVLRRGSPLSLNGRFLRLFDKQGSVTSNEELVNRFHTTPRLESCNSEFQSIPGSPIAYWVSAVARRAFGSDSSIGRLYTPRKGIDTGNNELFLRHWFEVGIEAIGFDSPSEYESAQSGRRWFPYNKGGEFRKWYGNFSYVVDWEDSGKRIRNYKDSDGQVRSNLRNQTYFFRSGITWTDVSSSCFGARSLPPGFMCDNSGSACYGDAELTPVVLGMLASTVSFEFLKILNPTLHFQAGNLSSLPLPETAHPRLGELTLAAVNIGRDDWNAYERSWDFQSLPILTVSPGPTPTLESSYTAWINQNRDTIAEMKRLEEENNRLFIDAYGLQDELTPDVPIEQITLTVNPAYRYGLKVGGGQFAVASNGLKVGSEGWSVSDGFGDELEARFRQDTMEELVSCAIGCMMGRYSLDEPGLIYAHSGNEGFDPSRYTTFPADEDGIVPLTDTEWFEDDACNRVVEFVSAAWDASHLEENLTFLADNLSPKRNESSRETIRRYLCDRFFKDHLQTYKNRPIYWLFSSGKQKAFQCLVYLHRYHEGTLSRLRTEYVIPLLGKVPAQIDHLTEDIAAATSSQHRKRLEKEKDKLAKQLVELQSFDEKLRHYADQRIHLDLDDGVKVNYGKFGDLLAEVKAVTGKKAEK